MACVILIQCMWSVLGIAWVISTQGCREQDRTIAAQLGIEIDMTYAVKIPQTTCCPSPLLIYPLLLISPRSLSSSPPHLSPRHLSSFLSHSLFSYLFRTLFSSHLAFQEISSADGLYVRVVSMPCCELFDLQSVEYQMGIFTEGAQSREE